METCLGLSKAIVTSGLSSALWRGAVGGCQNVQSQERERAAEEAPGKEEERSWAMKQLTHTTPRAQGSLSLSSVVGFVQVCWQACQTIPLKVKDQNGGVALILYLYLYLGLSPSPTSISTLTGLKWLTSYRSEHILCRVLSVWSSKLDLSFVICDAYRLVKAIDVYVTT